MWISLGIDVGKKQIDASIWHQGQAHELGTLRNTYKGFVHLAKRVEAFLAGARAAQGVRLVLESCGGYEERLEAFAWDRGWTVSKPNPRQVRQYAQALGLRCKTDRQDAIGLARYGAEQDPPVYHPQPSELRQLQSLLQRRGDLLKMLRAEQNRAEAQNARLHIDPAVPASLHRTQTLLKAEMNAIEEEIQTLIAEHAKLREGYDLLLSVPGVGQVVGPHLLAMLMRWDVMTQGEGTAKQLTAFAGLDPRLHQSGSSVFRHPRISKMGDSSIRALLYNGALGGATRTRPGAPLRVFYERLIGRGKSKKTALVASARKVLVWSWAVLQSGQPFDPTRHAKLPRTA